MKKLKKVLLKLRMKMLLRSYDFRKGLELWAFSLLSEDDKKIKHRKECDKWLKKLQPDERLHIMEWYKLKIDYLVYENTKCKTDEMQWRLFQTLLEHNQIKSLHEALKMKQDLADKK